MNSNVFACGGLVFITIGFSQRALHCCVLCIYKHTHIYVFCIYNVHTYILYMYVYRVSISLSGSASLSASLSLSLPGQGERSSGRGRNFSLSLSISHTLFLSLLQVLFLSLPLSWIEQKSLIIQQVPDNNPLCAAAGRLCPLCSFAPSPLPSTHCVFSLPQTHSAPWPLAPTHYALASPHLLPGSLYSLIFWAGP